MGWAKYIHTCARAKFRGDTTRVCISPAPQSPSPKLETSPSLTCHWLSWALKELKSIWKLRPVQAAPLQASLLTKRQSRRGAWLQFSGIFNIVNIELATEKVTLSYGAREVEPAPNLLFLRGLGLWFISLLLIREKKNRQKKSEKIQRLLKAAVFS